MKAEVSSKKSAPYILYQNAGVYHLQKQPASSQHH